MEKGKEISPRPKFLNAQRRPGWLALMCADKITVQWLKSHISSIKPWANATLKIVEEAEIPKSEIFTTYIPGSLDYTNDRILTLIEAQNETLNATNWRVLRRTDTSPMVELTLSVDYLSAEAIKAMGCAVSYRFGHIVMRSKSGKPTVTQAASGSSGGRTNPPISNPPPEQRAEPVSESQSVTEAPEKPKAERIIAGTGGRCDAPSGSSSEEHRSPKKGPGKGKTGKTSTPQTQASK